MQLPDGTHANRSSRAQDRKDGCESAGRDVVPLLSCARPRLMYGDPCEHGGKGSALNPLAGKGSHGRPPADAQAHANFKKLEQCTHRCFCC